MTPKPLFAKLGDEGYLAGTNLDIILADAKEIFPQVRREEIVVVPRTSLPEEYYWSAKMVVDFKDWKATGTYLLIKNFERSDAFKIYYP